MSPVYPLRPARNVYISSLPHVVTVVQPLKPCNRATLVGMLERSVLGQSVKAAPGRLVDVARRLDVLTVSRRTRLGGRGVTARGTATPPFSRLFALNDFLHHRRRVQSDAVVFDIVVTTRSHGHDPCNGYLGALSIGDLRDRARHVAADNGIEFGLRHVWKLSSQMSEALIVRHCIVNAFDPLRHGVRLFAPSS